MALVSILAHAFAREDVFSSASSPSARVEAEMFPFLAFRPATARTALATLEPFPIKPMSMEMGLLRR